MNKTSIRIYQIFAGAMFALVAVLLLIDRTVFTALFRGAFSISIALDLTEALAFITLAASAFLAIPVLAAVGGALLGIVNLYYLGNEVYYCVATHKFEAELLLYYALLTVASVLLIIYVLKKKSLFIALLIPGLWLIANMIHMVFGYAGKYFSVMLHSKNYIALIIPFLAFFGFLIFNPEKEKK